MASLKNIDFIEDPKEKYPYPPFAQDFLNFPSPIKIIKPSYQPLSHIFQSPSFPLLRRIIFTHSLDHPLGRVTSAYWAGVFYKNYPRFFEEGSFLGESPFKNYPLSQASSFIPPSGFGFGFTESLKKEGWKSL